MNRLYRETLYIEGSLPGPPGAYPALMKERIRLKGSGLPENEGLFVGYGAMEHALPYADQSGYDRENRPLELDTYVLENDRLRAVFIPSFGGRLWSLTDKLTRRELVVNNPVVRPCNFALRNAWLAGGIEFNCGVRGHSEVTSDRVFAAPYTDADGNPVLRLYSFERFRAVSWQLDFFLDRERPLLLWRARIENASPYVVPIYWWTTIAVEQAEGARVIVPAEEAYVNQGMKPMFIQPLPLSQPGGVDLTYPCNHHESLDHFYKIPQDSRKYEAYLFRDGKGVVHASTKRLRGRKMFVWGVSRGGGNWQRFLTGKDGCNHPYLEIQAGLAATQNESLPMPPDSVWEWLEAYGPMECDPRRVHGGWAEARQTVQAQLEDLLPGEAMERILTDTRSLSLTAVAPQAQGPAWGTLDNALRRSMGRRALSPQLDFGTLAEEQAPWMTLLHTGVLTRPDPSAHIVSYMVQDEWFSLIQRAAFGADRDNWHALYHLGLCYYARALYPEAEEAFLRSLALAPSASALHGLAHTRRVLGREGEGAHTMSRALRLDINDATLAKEAMRLAYDAGEYALAIENYSTLSSASQSVPMVRALYAASLAHAGRHAQAKDIMLENGGLVPPDLREGDTFLPLAYIYNQQQTAAESGASLAAEDVEVPPGIDYRMF